MVSKGDAQSWAMRLLPTYPPLPQTPPLPARFCTSCAPPPNIHTPHPPLTCPPQTLAPPHAPLPPPPPCPRVRVWLMLVAPQR